jgi:PAS domain S-box-containing protein
MDPTRRKTVFILALALTLVIALITVIVDEELRARLGETYWLISLIIVACVLVVLSGYAFDLSVQQKLKTLRAASVAPFAGDDGTGSDDGNPDEIMGLARNIERMAQSLQKVEANYRGIVEDQVDLICRFRPDGRLTFVNGAYARVFGGKRGDFTGKAFPPFTPGTAMAGETYTFERELVLPDQKRLWMLWTQRAIRDGNGAVIEYQAVGHDITLRKETEATLLRAKEAAEAADRAKSEFLAVVSHEIRTPINGVIGFAKMLQDTPLTADQREQLAMIHTSGLTLENLITDILDLSKIEAGKFEIEHSAFVLPRCVEDVCNFFAPQARSAGLSLSLMIEPGVPPIINGDETRVRQILTNLIGNAVKFTEQGGVKVHVSAAASEAMPDGIHHRVRVFFAVSDTGIGIPAEKIGELFRPFMQVDASSKRRRGGTGLGLVISKRLCDVMGGTVSVDSRAGEGSTFRFSIIADYDKRDVEVPVTRETTPPLPMFRPGLASG